MAALLPNKFTSWDMNEEEIIQSQLLTVPQKQNIQNQISQFAEEKLAIQFDSTNPVLFAQQEAEKRGSIDALQYLLDMSLWAEEEVRIKNNT